MVHKKADILENLTIDEELLAELQSRGVITSEIADNIRCRPVDMDKNRYLCSFIYQQPKPKLDVFIDVLRKKNQNHVIRLFELDPEKLGTDTTLFELSLNRIVPNLYIQFCNASLKPGRKFKPSECRMFIYLNKPKVCTLE